jgi:hypothetical protein
MYVIKNQNKQKEWHPATKPLKKKKKHAVFHTVPVEPCLLLLEAVGFEGTILSTVRNCPE